MILQKLIKTAKAEILVIGGLPEDAIIGLIKHGGMVYRVPVLVGEPLRYIVDLPPGKWQPLGFLDNIPEDVAKELVPVKARVFNGPTAYESFDKKIDWFWKATESLHSLVGANCLLKNPLGHCPVTTNEDFINKWFEEEDKVFTNPFLLVKTN